MASQIISAIVDPVLNPLLKMSPIMIILIVSLIVSLISVLMQKYLTDQKKLKRLKAEIKENQTLMKRYRDNPKKMMELQKRMMHPQMQMMKESFKPMLFTFIPFLLLFIWLSAHMSYLPIHPGNEFPITVHFNKGITGTATLNVSPSLEILSNTTQDVNSNTQWMLKAGDEGEYTATVSFGGAEYNKDFIISKDRYVNPVKTYSGSVKKIIIGNEPLKPLGNFNLLGLGKPSWIVIYIILSLILTTLFRRVMKVV